MVPVLSIIFMFLSLALSVLLPLALVISYRKKYKADLLTFFVGGGVWFLFAGTLEQILHYIILQLLPIGKSIAENAIIYALYGGFCAGIFEESGRFIAMKTVLKKKYDNKYNALMYGAGHGGIEAATILGTAMTNNIIYSILINLNKTELLTASLDEASKAIIERQFEQLITTAPSLFVCGAFERISAVIFHIALSVIVFIAVTKRKTLLFPLAIILHMFMDSSIAIISAKTDFTPVMLEAYILVFALLTATFSWLLWKKNFKESSNTVS